MLQTCCHIYTQTRKYIRTKKKNLAPYCLFLQLQQGADMKAQVLTTARRVHKHCRGSTNFWVHCTNITSVSLTSLCFPLNFSLIITIVRALLHPTPLCLLPHSRNLPWSYFFHLSLSVCPHLHSSRGPLKKMYWAHFMEMFPVVHYHRSWPCSAESPSRSQFTCQTPQAARSKKYATFSRAAPPPSRRFGFVEPWNRAKGTGNGKAVWAAVCFWQRKA